MMKLKQNHYYKIKYPIIKHTNGWLYVKVDILGKYYSTMYVLKDDAGRDFDTTRTYRLFENNIVNNPDYTVIEISEDVALAHAI